MIPVIYFEYGKWWVAMCPPPGPSVSRVPHPKAYDCQKNGLPTPNDILVANADRCDLSTRREFDTYAQAIDYIKTLP